MWMYRKVSLCIFAVCWVSHSHPLSIGNTLSLDDPDDYIAEYLFLQLSKDSTVSIELETKISCYGPCWNHTEMYLIPAQKDF